MQGVNVHKDVGVDDRNQCLVGDQFWEQYFQKHTVKDTKKKNFVKNVQVAFLWGKWTPRKLKNSNR